MLRGGTIFTALAVLLAATGCQGMRSSYHGPGPGGVAADYGPGSEDIVVFVPPQKVIVKQPSGSAEVVQNVAAAPGAPNAVSAGRLPSVERVDPAVPGTPNAVSQYVSNPSCGTACANGAQGAIATAPQPAAGPVGTSGAPVATTVSRPRARLALTTTTINVPVLCLRPVPVIEAPDAAKTAAPQTTPTQGSGPVIPSVPSKGVPGALPQGVQGSSVPAPTTGAPIVQGSASVPVTQPQAPVSVPLPALTPPPSSIPAANSAITPEQLQALQKRIEELEAAKKAQDDPKKEIAPLPMPKP